MDVETARNQLRTIVSQKSLYSGKILNLRVDQVKFPSGCVKPREIVEHKPAAAILAVDREENILLVAQYRHAVDDVVYEIPAGLLEAGESAAQTAARELQEEIGFMPGKLEELFTLYSSPGFSDEEVILFFATDLTPSQLPQDEDEYIEVVKFKADELTELIANGQIKDSKTIAAIYWYQLRKAQVNAGQTG